MPGLFIAAVPPKAVAKELAEVRSQASNADLCWWNSEKRLVVKLRHFGYVDEEAAKKALHRLHVLAPVAGVKVSQTSHLFQNKALWVNVLGLGEFADAIYMLTKDVGAHQTFDQFICHLTLAWPKLPHAMIAVNVPPELKFNVEELVLLRSKPGNWGPYEFVDKVKLRQYCHRCGHHCHC